MSKRWPGRGKASPQRLSKLVADVFPSDAPEEAVTHRLVSCWLASVSARIAENAVPVAYRNGVLTVHTSTTSWSNALSLEAPQLLTRLRARIAGVTLTRLVFRVGKLPELPELVRRRPPPPELLPIDALPEAAARELAKISSDGVRSSVAHAMAASLATPVAKKKRKGG